MTIRRERQRALLGQQESSVHRERRHHALLKKDDVLRVEAEMIVLFEEIARRAVVDVAGHDVPANRPPAVASVSKQLLGEKLKKRLVLDRRDGKFSFRA